MRQTAGIGRLSRDQKCSSCLLHYGWMEVLITVICEDCGFFVVCQGRAWRRGQSASLVLRTFQRATLYQNADEA
jgi:hypothetical protein